MLETLLIDIPGAVITIGVSRGSRWGVEIYGDPQ